MPKTLSKLGSLAKHAAYKITHPATQSRLAEQERRKALERQAITVAKYSQMWIL